MESSRTEGWAAAMDAAASRNAKRDRILGIKCPGYHQGKRAGQPPDVVRTATESRWLAAGGPTGGARFRPFGRTGPASGKSSSGKRPSTIRLIVPRSTPG